MDNPPLFGELFDPPPVGAPSPPPVGELFDPPNPVNPESSPPPLGEIDINTLRNLDDDVKELILDELLEDFIKKKLRQEESEIKLLGRIIDKRAQIEIYNEILENPFFSYNLHQQARERKEKATKVINLYQRTQRNIKAEVGRRSNTINFMLHYFY